MYVQVDFADSFGLVKTSKDKVKINNKLFDVTIFWLENSDEPLIS